MSEAGNEFDGPLQSRAEVIKKLEVNGRELVVLKASPRTLESGTKSEGGETPAPVLYVQGLNTKPRKDDNQVKTGHDIGVLAESIGCDVYSVIRTGAGSDSAQLSEADYPEDVAVTQVHRAKAEETLGAIRNLQSEGVLGEHLDLMGYSDGGIVAVALLDLQPELFNRFVITNTPGLEDVSTSRSYAQAVREFGHLAVHKMKHMMRRNAEPQSKLTFKSTTGDGYEESSYISKPRLETKAIARTRSLVRLLPNILARNENLRGYIVSTEKDRIAPADRVERELAGVLGGDARIQARRTGWETHTMGYGSQERPEKLQDQAAMMRELRN